MAKNQPDNTPASPEGGQTAGDGGGAPPPGGRPPPRPGGGASAAGQGRSVGQRKGQFLVTSRRSPAMQLMGLQPLSMDVVEQALRSAPDIEIVDNVGPKSAVGALADGFGSASGVLVARMTEQKAAILHQQGQGRLIVERDQYLTMLDPSFQPPLVAGSFALAGPVVQTTIVVVGRNNAPVKDAEVYLFGSLLPATGVTDEQGQVTLNLYGETPQSLRGLYVKPRFDYWSFYQENPDISTDEPNVVGLRPLTDWAGLKNFPQQQLYGWGQKAMRLDQLPQQYRGQGIKVGVIDSGAAALTHDDLRKVSFGFDIVNKKTNPEGWTDDVISHGSHCAGIICGTDNAVGVRGFAPDAEVHACKLFPGGQTSQLIEALEYCIEKQLDVVNMSLGGAEPSEALEQQIIRAKRAGVACIVAAGNSGGPVQYPASSPHVLAVAAIGKLGEFPPDSYHSQTVTQFLDADGIFSAKFSCFGPEIAVCAPGVAIASSVPANNYAVWDGTSMAAPHVTGLAALVLAHHPDFQGPYKTRGPERVERLFQILRQSCRRLNLGDPRRTGAGMPDVLVALGLQPQIGAPVLAQAGAALGGVMAPAAFGMAPAAFAGPYGQGGYPQSGYPQGGLAEGGLSPQGWFGTVAGQQPRAMAMAGGIDPSYLAWMQAMYAQPQYGMVRW